MSIFYRFKSVQLCIVHTNSMKSIYNNLLVELWFGLQNSVTCVNFAFFFSKSFSENELCKNDFWP